MSSRTRNPGTLETSSHHPRIAEFETPLVTRIVLFMPQWESPQFHLLIKLDCRRYIYQAGAKMRSGPQRLCLRRRGGILLCAVTVGRSASYIMVDDFACTPAVARDALAWRGLGPTTRAFAAIDGKQCRTVVVSNECASVNWSAMNLHNIGPRRDYAELL